MCDTVLIPCNKDHTASGGGTIALVDAIVFAWKVAKVTARLTADFAIGLAVITAVLYRATRWTVRALWRGYRWYVTLPVNHGQRQPVAPVAAVTDKPADKATAMTLADLRLKEPANS